MRRIEMVTVLGCLLVCALFGGVMLSSTSVGSPVAMGEAGKIMGGACSDEIAEYRIVCNGTCGTSTVNKRKSNASGNSNTGKICKSTSTCTYDGVGAASCSSGS